MPVSTGTVETTDGYPADDATNAAIVAPLQGMQSVQFTVSTAMVAVQVAKMNKKDNSLHWDPFESVFAPGQDGFTGEVHGVRMRSYVAGTPAAVVINGYFSDDPVPFQVPAPLSGSFDSGGHFTPPPSGGGLEWGDNTDDDAQGLGFFPEGTEEEGYGFNVDDSSGGGIQLASRAGGGIRLESDAEDALVEFISNGGFNFTINGGAEGINFLNDGSSAGTSIIDNSGDGGITIRNNGSGTDGFAITNDGGGPLVITNNNAGEMQIVSNTGDLSILAAASLLAIQGNDELQLSGQGGTLLIDINPGGDATIHIDSTEGAGISLELASSGSYLTATNLPTTNPGGTNRIWNNGGVLNIT